jgi:glutaredoxin 3
MNGKPRIRIYGSDFCGFCIAARALLTRKGLAFEDVPVGADPELRRKMEEISGGRTIPQIFIDDRPIGGFDELYAMNESGDLDRMLGIGEDA